MTTSSDHVSVVDTNILVYAHLTDSPHHSPSRDLLEQARLDKQALAVSPQILLEFYAVMTNPRQVSSPFTPAEVQDAISRLLSIPAVSVLPIPADVAEQTVALAAEHNITKTAVFDVQIAATMLSNGINRIYTFDRSGFKPFDDITIQTP